MNEVELKKLGSALFQSAHNLRRSSLSLTSLMLRVKEALTSQFISYGSLEPLDGESEGSDWLTTAWVENYCVRSRTRGRRKLGTISVMVRLCETEDNEHDAEVWPWLDQANLIVGWHHNEEVWWINNFDALHENTFKHRGFGLWQWDSGNISEDGYFFALPLFAPRTEVHLQNIVAAPLLTLFKSDEPWASAKEALKGVPTLQPAHD